MREISVDNLCQILEDHENWINTHKKEGRRANLSGAKLVCADLSDANLVYADLSGANLSRANLMGANLSNANLSSANLSDANLRNANLSDADLSHADLNGVIYLSIDELSKVKTLYKAKLNLSMLSLMKQVRRKYPHLLEKPKE
ncbi:MAG: pentapeptide repeat-containing protein [Candidatus Scalindua sp.]